MSQLTEEQLILADDAAERMIIFLKSHRLLNQAGDNTTHTIHAVARNITRNLVLNVVDPNTKPLDNDGST